MVPLLGGESPRTTQSSQSADRPRWGPRSAVCGLVMFVSWRQRLTLLWSRRRRPGNPASMLRRSEPGDALLHALAPAAKRTCVYVCVRV